MKEEAGTMRQYTWDEYYEKFYDWAESIDTVISQCEMWTDNLLEENK